MHHPATTEELDVAFVYVGRSRQSRSSFRAYVHRTPDVVAIVAASGLVNALHRTTLIWQLAVYEWRAA